MKFDIQLSEVNKMEFDSVRDKMDRVVKTKANNEVDYIFEVPIAYFLDKRNDILRKIFLKQQNIHSIEFKWNKERIWGVTAIIIILLREKLLKQ